MQLAFGLLIMSSSLRLFGSDFIIRRREEDGEGLSRQCVGSRSLLVKFSATLDI
jgi:hypothetical protein